MKMKDVIAILAGAAEIESENALDDRERKLARRFDALVHALIAVEREFADVLDLEARGARMSVLRASVCEGCRGILERAVEVLGGVVEWAGFEGGSTHWTVVFLSDRTPEEVREAVWELTRTIWCEVEVIG
jgi:hypothetical protein